MSPLEEDAAATDDQPPTNSADPDIPECPNCGELRPGHHCAWCGQNDRDYRRSSWSLIADFFRETFELDSKLLRTLKLLLLKPGRLSAEFSRNRRASYVSPVRLYLFASVIYLFAISLAPTRDAESGTGDAGQPPPTSAETDATEDAPDSLVPTEAQLDYLRALLPPRSVEKLDELMNRRDGAEIVGAYLLPFGDVLTPPSLLQNLSGVSRAPLHPAYLRTASGAAGAQSIGDALAYDASF